jgi:hypothetical protein
MSHSSRVARPSFSSRPWRMETERLTGPAAHALFRAWTEQLQAKTFEPPGLPKRRKHTVPPPARSPNSSCVSAHPGAICVPSADEVVGYGNAPKVFR